MKYLDTFNESFYSKDRIARKIKADTDSAIVYLIDEGFKSKVEIYDGFFMLEVIKIEGGFLWKDVKDEFLPLFEMLEMKYIINDVFIIQTNSFDRSLLKRGFRRTGSNAVMDEIDLDRHLNDFNIKSVQIEIKIKR